MDTAVLVGLIVVLVAASVGLGLLASSRVSFRPRRPDYQPDPPAAEDHAKAAIDALSDVNGRLMEIVEQLAQKITAERNPELEAQRLRAMIEAVPPRRQAPVAPRYDDGLMDAINEELG